MNVHKNARLTPPSRAELVRRVLVAGQVPVTVAIAMGVTTKTVRKRVERFVAEGKDGLANTRPVAASSVRHASAPLRASQ